MDSSLGHQASPYIYVCIYLQYIIIFITVSAFDFNAHIHWNLGWNSCVIGGRLVSLKSWGSGVTGLDLDLDCGGCMPLDQSSIHYLLFCKIVVTVTSSLKDRSVGDNAGQGLRHCRCLMRGSCHHTCYLLLILGSGLLILLGFCLAFATPFLFTSSQRSFPQLYIVLGVHFYNTHTSPFSSPFIPSIVKI